MTPDDLKYGRELLARATPGEWSIPDVAILLGGMKLAISEDVGSVRVADCKLIVWLHNHAHELLDKRE